MVTSTRLPSGGTIFASSLASLARIVDTWLVRMSPGLGTSTMRYAIAKVTIGSTISTAAAAYRLRRTHFQLICSRKLGLGAGGGPPGGRPPPPGGRGGAGGGCLGGGGGGVPSSARLTTSIGSR